MDWNTNAPPQLPQLLLRENALTSALLAKGGLHAKLENQSHRLRDEVLDIIDDALRQGLAARVNLYLQPLGPTIPTASSNVYDILTRVRRRLARGAGRPDWRSPYLRLITMV